MEQPRWTGPRPRASPRLIVLPSSPGRDGGKPDRLRPLERNAGKCPLRGLPSTGRDTLEAGLTSPGDLAVREPAGAGHQPAGRAAWRARGTAVFPAASLRRPRAPPLQPRPPRHQAGGRRLPRPRVQGPPLGWAEAPRRPGRNLPGAEKLTAGGDYHLDNHLSDPPGRWVSLTCSLFPGAVCVSYFKGLTPVTDWRSPPPPAPPRGLTRATVQLPAFIIGQELHDRPADQHAEGHRHGPQQAPHQVSGVRLCLERRLPPCCASRTPGSGRVTSAP